MKTPSVKEVETFVGGLWKDEYEQPKITVARDGEACRIKIEKMYSFAPLDFARLLAISEFFDTKNINDSRYSREGCETCDYGSSYQITLTVGPD